MSKWILKKKGADYATLSKNLDVDPLIVRLLLNRGLETEEAMREFLYGDKSLMNSPELLDGIDDASEILLGKIRSGKHIRIVGDYDVDGVCATAILLKGLIKFGAKVDHYIPKRFVDGYGLNLNIIDKAYQDGVDTILTCDNGISAMEQIAKAKSYGMTVIITDHHEIPFDEKDGDRVYSYPEADVIVDPKLPYSHYPYKEICGAFVAYKLIEYMAGDTEDELMYELLQYAALATVADVMDLLKENRILVKTGLDHMMTKPAIGIKALLNLNDLLGKKLGQYHLGFVLGPSINAAGRLDDADKALDLLMSEDDKTAIERAEVLKKLNDDRKSITEKCTQEAIDKIENTDIINDKVIVVALDDCHEGVIGIVAGRLKEKYYKPVLVVTKNEDCYKGSGRSLEAYNMYEEMTAVKELFIQYGGHAGAAGFSIKEENIDLLRKRLNENCSLTEDDMTEKLYIDADMPFAYCGENIMNQLELLEPCGNGNPSPLFARNDVTIVSARLFGVEGKVGKYKVTDSSGRPSELTLFRRNEEFRQFITAEYGQEAGDNLFKSTTVNIPIMTAYYPKWNEYNGVKTVQFIISDYKKKN